MDESPDASSPLGPMSPQRPRKRDPLYRTGRAFLSVTQRSVLRNSVLANIPGLEGYVGIKPDQTSFDPQLVEEFVSKLVERFGGSELDLLEFWFQVGGAAIGEVRGRAATSVVAASTNLINGAPLMSSAISSVVEAGFSAATGILGLSPVDAALAVYEGRAADLDLRLTRLRAWFAEAHRFEDLVDDSLPNLSPPAFYRENYRLRKKGGSGESYTGWLSVKTGEPLLEADIPAALVKGYLQERELAEYRARELKLLISAAGPASSPEEAARWASASAQVAAGLRAAHLADWWRLKRNRNGRPSLGDGSDCASALSPAVPWWESAVTQGLKPTAQEAAAVFEAIKGWAWPAVGASLPRWAALAASHGVTAPLVDASPGEFCGCEELLAKLLTPGGEELVARARVVLRFEAAVEASEAPPTQLEAPAVLSPAGEPDPRRLRLRVLDAAERRRLFGGDGEEGSAAEVGRPLPVGSVIVACDDGSAPYLRGRGWHVRPSRQLVAWNWRGEPGPLLPIGGISTGPHLDADGRNNLSPLPIHGFVHFGGHRWWNMMGMGTLSDETAEEWEDRRDRARVQAHAALAPGGGGLLPGAMRWVMWTLMGHEEGVEDDLSAEMWRDTPAVVPALGDQLSFIAEPATQRSERSDPILHDRTWSTLMFSQEMRAHAVHATIERREHKGGPWDSVAWAKTLLSELKAVPPDRLEAARELFRGCGPAYWDLVDERRAFDAKVAAEERVEVDAHREWMSRRARLIEVTADGPLEPVAWRYDAFPEPLLPPACMDIPIVERPMGVDFSALKDQGNGPPGRPASYLSREALMAFVAEGYESRVDEAMALRENPEPVLPVSSESFDLTPEAEEVIRQCGDIIWPPDK